MTLHDGLHIDVVNSYLRDILLHDYSAPDIEGVDDPIDRVPDDVWPCVLSSLVSLLQVTLEALSDMDEVTMEEEVDSWLVGE